MVNHPKRSRRRYVPGQVVRVIPVEVQQPNKPESRQIVGEAPDNLSAEEVAQMVGLPEGSLLDGKIVRRKGEARWLLAAWVEFGDAEEVEDTTARTTLGNAHLYDVPRNSIQWIKMGDVALFISYGASGGPNVVAYHVKGDDREWMGGVEFVVGQPPIVMKPL